MGSEDGNTLARIVDASANRAGEALRVLEDWHRFGGPPADRFSRPLKDLRHALAAAVRGLGIPAAARLAARDAARDAGRPDAIRAAYPDAGALLAANWRRLSEAARSLEEAARLVSLPAARAFSRARFSAYALERESGLSLSRSARLAGVRLYLVATPRPGWSERRLERVVSEAIRGGAGCVQLRVKEGDDREILALARRLRAVTARERAVFIVNDRPDLARLSRADGVHVGQDDLPVEAARRITGEGGIIGLSTHSLAQARASARAGADYIGFGPLWPTLTKPGRPAIGLRHVGRATRDLAIPVFAIGGVSADSVARVRRAGADRVSVSSAILDAADPRKAARAILAGLSARRP